MDRVRTLIMLGRPRTCMPGVLAFALGYSYTGGGVTARMALGGVLAFSIGFCANLHNAATDVPEDSRNLPGRARLVATVGHARLMAFCRVLGGLMLLGGLALGTYFTILMTLAVVGLHQYSAPPVRSKGRPLLGLWVFAQAVVFPFLFGWTTEPGGMLETLVASIGATLHVGAAPPWQAAWQSWRYLGMWFFLTLWFMAKGCFKNVPDYAGDRAAGLRTSATVFATRRDAALAAAIATGAAYLSLGVLVAAGLERPAVLGALVWLFPVMGNCARLVRAADPSAGNDVLRADMALSTGFIATLLLLVAPRPVNVALAVGAGLVILGSDLVGLDSRRRQDASPAKAA
ncbi:MAG TPA: UbiA family prenyltransferase [Polyangiaceae bacterium]|nr:UbiA family prenyltransferase [Polyangiaceae bacterium]